MKLYFHPKITKIPPSLIGDTRNIMKQLGSILFFTIVISFLLSTASAQDTQNNRFIITLSEADIVELDFRRELLLKKRSEFNIVSETASADLLAIVSQKLIDIGWASTWQQTREDMADSHIANYTAIGGANLRLELNKTTDNNYRLLLFKY